MPKKVMIQVTGMGIFRGSFSGSNLWNESFTVIKS